MTVRAIDAAGEIVKMCTISTQYKATNVYCRIKCGDASTHGGRVVRWEIRDNRGHLVESIAAPGF